MSQSTFFSFIDCVLCVQTFITSAAAGAGQQQAGIAGTLRASDLEALRQYKRKKLNVGHLPLVTFPLAHLCFCYSCLVAGCVL